MKTIEKYEGEKAVAVSYHDGGYLVIYDDGSRGYERMFPGYLIKEENILRMARIEREGGIIQRYHQLSRDEILDLDDSGEIIRRTKVGGWAFFEEILEIKIEDNGYGSSVHEFFVTYKDLGNIEDDPNLFIRMA